MGVAVGPGLITFARMPRLANSAVQVRTKETKAAFVAEYARKPGTPICHAWCRFGARGPLFLSLSCTEFVPNSQSTQVLTSTKRAFSVQADPKIVLDIFLYGNILTLWQGRRQ